MAVSEAQRRAIASWRTRNMERAKYLRDRSSAKYFIRHYATTEDMDMLVETFKENKNYQQKEERNSSRL